MELRMEVWDTSRIPKTIVRQAKRRTMIKGEMMMMGIKEKHHHIQECVKMFKESDNILGDIKKR
jgi:alanine-alpha-ketoisovalerate/valine-pyruvate aminotransferase